MTQISVRYIVDDVGAAVDFYTSHLEFERVTQPAPGFAILRRDKLRLLLNSPDGGGGAGRRLADGSVPTPGSWNRFPLEVRDVEAMVAELRRAGVHFRGDIVTDKGGRQALAVDPAGNLVELFEPAGR